MKTLWLQCSICLALLVGFQFAIAQKSSEASKPAALATQSPGNVRERLIVATDLVTLTINVKDRDGNKILGLDRNAFSILDDKVPQQISFFSDAESPISIGIIFDVSGSMSGDKTERARQALASFIQTSDPHDDFFLIAFNARSSVLIDKTHDADALLRELSGVHAEGNTALYDAVYLGADKLQRAEHPKRAILLITDGRENDSRHSSKEVNNLLAESDLLLYSICVLDPIRLTGKAGMQVQNTLNRLSKVTGGRAFFPENISQVDEAFDQIALDLRHQYSIGYRPKGFISDGKWHRIKIKVEPPSGYSRVVVRSRDGYYASPR